MHCKILSTETFKQHCQIVVKILLFIPKFTRINSSILLYDNSLYLINIIFTEYQLCNTSDIETVEPSVAPPTQAFKPNLDPSKVMMTWGDLFPKKLDAVAAATTPEVTTEDDGPAPVPGLPTMNPIVNRGIKAT